MAIETVSFTPGLPPVLEASKEIHLRKELQRISAALSSLQDAVNILDARFEEGTWTPTITLVTNVTTVTPVTGHYARIGNTVHCWGSVTVTATSVAVSEFRMSLPVASNLAVSGDLIGSISRSSNDARGSIYHVSDLAHARFFPDSTATGVFWGFHFTYVIQ